MVKAIVTPTSGTFPPLVCPPASVVTSNTTAPWYAANAATFNRFWLPTLGTYRYINIRVGVSSGNIEVGVVKLSGANRLGFTKVMGSGLIACPVAGNAQIDCGATRLGAGDYALFLFADNTTFSTPNGNTVDSQSSRIMANQGFTAAGVPASGTIAAWGQRSVQAITLEADI